MNAGRIKSTAHYKVHRENICIQTYIAYQPQTHLELITAFIHTLRNISPNILFKSNNFHSVREYMKLDVIQVCG